MGLQIGFDLVEAAVKVSGLIVNACHALLLGIIHDILRNSESSSVATNSGGSVGSIACCRCDSNTWSFNDNITRQHLRFARKLRNIDLR